MRKIFCAVLLLANFVVFSNDTSYEVLLKKAEGGDAQSQFYVGLKTYGVDNPDYKTSIMWFSKSANQGFAPAQHYLATCFSKGSGVVKDSEQAFELWKKAAEQNYPESLYNCGVCYARGEGVKKDMYKAVEYWKKAAERDNVNAMYIMGSMYLTGSIVSKDIELAVRYITSSADRENIEAQLAIAAMYYQGLNIGKNIELAVKYWEKAAQNNNILAMNNLAMVAYNKGDKKSFAKWLKSAADLGDYASLYNLGVAYEKGDGVEKNGELGKKMKDMARAQGYGK